MDEFCSKNLAQDTKRGMREAASCGFWVASSTPYGYSRVMVQDGFKKRGKLEPNQTNAPVVTRISDMAEVGRGMLYITSTLNDDGIASPRGRLWAKTSVQAILRDEVYTGSLVWGTAAKDKADPVRMDRAFPAIIPKAQFRRVNGMMCSRAPRITHPGRVGSSYLLNGLVKCYRCRRSPSCQDSKSGSFHYYVCQSLMKPGSGSCDSPRLNARGFEELIVERIGTSILTAGNIGDLTNVVSQQLDGLASEQRQRLETIESELADVRGRLGRLWDLLETTDDDMDDTALRIKTSSERQRRLEASTIPLPAQGDQG